MAAGGSVPQDLPPQTAVSQVQTKDDKAVQALHGYLKSGKIAVKEIVVVHQRPARVSPNAVAWVYGDASVSGDHKVYVAGWSANYAKVLQGDRYAFIALAAQIAHENVHLTGGGEDEAYKVQEDMLRKLGGKSSDIQATQIARKQVLQKIAQTGSASFVK